MILRPFLYDDTACASYLFGCLSRSALAVVDPHAELVGEYLDAAERVGAPIVAVFETHLQADHLSGLPQLVGATGATAYAPNGAGVDFDCVKLDDGAVVELGNTSVLALATPGHAPAHHAYVVADGRRTEEPWLVFTGDSLLVGDVGRPDLHAGGDPRPLARESFASVASLLELPDHVLVYPGHYGGSVCGRALSANPFSSIGFERRHNPALAYSDAESFADALLADMPPPPARQAEIVAANKSRIDISHRKDRPVVVAATERVESVLAPDAAILGDDGRIGVGRFPLAPGARCDRDLLECDALVPEYSLTLWLTVSCSTPGRSR